MPLVLASTSPQRRAILEQLRIPFEAVAPDYEEHDPPDADPVALVRDHAAGKARSVHRPGRVTVGVDTTVHLDGRVYGKPADAADATAMLGELAGRTHTVLSGVCVLTDDAERIDHAETLVTFRALAHGRGRAVRRERRMGGPRRRLRDPGARWTARRANRGRLPERRRPPGRAAPGDPRGGRPGAPPLDGRCEPRGRRRAGSGQGAAVALPAGTNRLQIGWELHSADR